MFTDALIVHDALGAVPWVTALHFNSKTIATRMQAAEWVIKFGDDSEAFGSVAMAFESVR
ncbi:hypothetical protein [Trinickia mobilis]|uniref:hypothetical protein n=1 Tax=Trinickia mobilis TaxID=2816356 RepID=UPI001A90204A|nr:hypothetical protein [Trinickia mobilis]